MSWLDKFRKIDRRREDDERCYRFLDYTINEFLNAAPLAVHFFDKNANLLDCNEAALQIYNMKEKQEYIDNYFMFLPFNQPSGKRSQEVLKEVISECFENGHSTSEIMYNKADGAQTLISVTCVSFKHRDNYMAVMFARDTSAAEPAGDRDFEADLRATLMLDSTPMACFLADSHYNALDCNAEALQLFGYSSKDEASRRFSEICPQTQTISGEDIESMNAAISKALTTGRYTFEFTCFDTIGKPIPCNITLVRIYYRKEHVVAIYIQDLREMKKIMKEMQRIEIAEEENRAKSRFLARMSHEIRTPLTAILGISEVQLLSGTHSTELENIFSQIYSSSNLLLRIINDLLDLSQVEAEKLSIVSQRYEFPSLVVDTVQLNLFYVGNKEIDFAIKINPLVPFALVGDELRIKQIMNNLLSNAFKYTDFGTVTLIIDVEPTDDPEIITLVIRVHDTGQGMTKEQSSSLFKDEYVRFNEEKNYKVQGAGLGMSITHQLVNMMGGTISVNSEPNVGSQFVVKIPQKKEDDELLGEEVAKTLGNLKVSQFTQSGKTTVIHRDLSHGKILVVDDTEMNLHVVESLLSPYGMSVEKASSGFAAIDKIKNGEVFDVIFMDHMMPDLDGVETAKRISGMGYENPIVALTANAIVGQADFFIKNGFADFLSKPIDVQKLNECLIRLIPNNPA